MLLGLVVLTLAACESEGRRGVVGDWRGWLDSPGGELPFGLQIRPGDDGLQAVIINGEERILVDDVVYDGENLLVFFPHYDSTIRAVVDLPGYRMDGEWSKRSRDGWSRLPFHATSGYSRSEAGATSRTGVSW